MSKGAWFRPCIFFEVLLELLSSYLYNKFRKGKELFRAQTGQEANMFKYEGLDAVDDYAETSSHSGYYHFLVKKADTGETVLNFYTNGNLDGMFYWSDYDCNYHQTRGTCQFSLPVKSKRALRDALRKMALKQLGEEY